METGGSRASDARWTTSLLRYFAPEPPTFQPFIIAARTRRAFEENVDSDVNRGNLRRTNEQTFRDVNIEAGIMTSSYHESDGETHIESIQLRTGCPGIVIRGFVRKPT